MPTGLQVINDYGTVQIDENYRNLFLRTSGTGGVPSASGSMTSPLLAMQSAGLSCGFGLTDGNGIVYQTNSAGSFKWWIWDVIANSSGNYGFQVFNASGQMVFDALQKPMRIVGHHLFTAETQWSNQSFTYPAGREYAVIIGTQPVWYIRSREGSSREGYEIRKWTREGAAKVNGNVITLGWITRSDETFIDDNPTQIKSKRENMHIIVVDVTNY